MASLPLKKSNQITIQSRNKNKNENKQPAPSSTDVCMYSPVSSPLRWRGPVLGNGPRLQNRAPPFGKEADNRKFHVSICRVFLSRACHYRDVRSWFYAKTNVFKVHPTYVPGPVLKVHLKPHQPTSCPYSLVPGHTEPLGRVHRVG
jgi:hypothetical protein